MKTSDILKKAMRDTHITQEQLRDRLGFANQSGVSMRINRENQSVNSLLEVLDELGYELVIQPKKRGRRPDGQEVVTK
jgi:hypothetical protein